MKKLILWLCTSLIMWGANAQVIGKTTTENYKADFEKKSNKVSKNYEKGLQETANNYLKLYRDCEEYTDYCDERQKIINKYNNLKRTLEKKLSKNLDLEVDQTTKDFVKEYLDNYLGDLYYFRAPRTVYI
mgnify:CR=1 FL=1